MGIGITNVMTVFQKNSFFTRTHCVSSRLLGYYYVRNFQAMQQTTRDIVVDKNQKPSKDFTISSQDPTNYPKKVTLNIE